MNIFVKTLTGKSFLLEIEETNTWGEIKQKIAEQQEIDVSRQRLIIAGKEMNDQEAYSVIAKQIKHEGTVHLVYRLNKLSLEDYEPYAVVHNYYGEKEGAKLSSFQYALPVSFEKPEEWNDIFEKMYRTFQERIAKNNNNNYQNKRPIPVFALVAVKKNTAQLYPNTSKAHTLIAKEEELNYKELCYMLSDGTLNSAPPLMETQLTEINCAFRLFCAQKQMLNPEYIRIQNEKIRAECGELICYVDRTAEALFADRDQNYIQQLIKGIDALSRGFRPDEHNLMSTEINQFDLSALLERFSIVKSDLAAKPEDKEKILTQYKALIPLILSQKVTEFKSHYVLPVAQDEPQKVNELRGILQELITNIEQNKNHRKAPWQKKGKLDSLKSILEWLNEQKEPLNEEKMGLVVTLIQNVCAQKRNLLGFFSPHSVQEFNEKLKIINWKQSESPVDFSKASFFDLTKDDVEKMINEHLTVSHPTDCGPSCF